MVLNYHHEHRTTDAERTILDTFTFHKRGHIFTNSLNPCVFTQMMNSIDSICIKMLMYNMNDLGFLVAFSSLMKQHWV